MNAKRAASSLVVVVICIIPSLYGHKDGFSGAYSGASAGSYAGGGGFGGGGSDGHEIGGDILNEVSKGIQAIASGFAGAAAKAGSYGGGYGGGGGGGGGSYGGGGGSYGGGGIGPGSFGKPLQIPGTPGTSDIVVSVAGPDGEPQHSYGGGFGGAFAGGSGGAYGSGGPDNGIIVTQIDSDNIPAHIFGGLHNHGAQDGIVVTAIKRGSGPAVVTTTEIKNGKLVPQPNGVGCNTGCSNLNPNDSQQPNYYPSGSGVSVHTQKYTGPFPGPSGSIHDYKPSTGVSPDCVSGQCSGVPHNNQVQSNNPNAGNYNPENSEKYNGPFPGPTGSIHDSKPVLPSNRPGSNYGPFGSTGHPQPEVSGVAIGVSCSNGKCETSGHKYTGPFPGSLGSIFDSKPATQGNGGRPPGHGDVPPGHGGVPPGHGGVPPGHGGVPPGHQGGYPNQPYPQEHPGSINQPQNGPYNPINDQKYTGPFPGRPGSIDDYKPAPGKGTSNNNYPNQGSNTQYPGQVPVYPQTEPPIKGCSGPGNSCKNPSSQPSNSKPVGCNGPTGSCSNAPHGNKCPYPGACNNGNNAPDVPPIVEEDCSKPGGCSFPHKFKPRPGYVCNSYGACTPQHPTTDSNHGGQKPEEPDYEDLQFGKPNHGGQNPQIPNYGGQTEKPNHGGQNPQIPNYGGQSQGPNYGGQNPNHGGQNPQTPNYGGQSQGPNHGGKNPNPNHGGQPAGPNNGGQPSKPNHGGQPSEPNYDEHQQPNYGGQQPSQPNYGGQQPNVQPDGSSNVNLAKPNPESPSGTPCAGSKCLDYLGNHNPSDISGGYPVPSTNIQGPYLGGPSGESAPHSGTSNEGYAPSGETCQGLECLKHLPEDQDGDHIAQVPFVNGNTDNPSKPLNEHSPKPNCGVSLCGGTSGDGALPDHSAITFDNDNEDGKYGGAGAYAGTGSYAGGNVGDLARSGNVPFAGAAAAAAAGAGAGAAPFGKGFPGGVKGGSYSASYSSAASASASSSYAASSHS